MRLPLQVAAGFVGVGVLQNVGATPNSCSENGKSKALSKNRRCEAEESRRRAGGLQQAKQQKVDIGSSGETTSPIKGSSWYFYLKTIQILADLYILLFHCQLFLYNFEILNASSSC
jgi:hypothetical protein